MADISTGGLADLAADIHIAQGRRLLVVVDQLEELFTADHEPTMIEQFLDALLGLPTDQQGMRSPRWSGPGWSQPTPTEPDTRSPNWRMSP